MYKITLITRRRKYENWSFYTIFFINELYPDICKATYKLLKNQGLNIDYPLNQTCCGQPMANSGCAKDVKVLAINFVNNFKDYDYIVAPHGSCVTMVKRTLCRIF